MFYFLGTLSHRPEAQGGLSRRNGYQFRYVSYCVIWVIEQGSGFLAGPGWWVWQ